MARALRIVGLAGMVAMSEPLIAADRASATDNAQAQAQAQVLFDEEGYRKSLYRSPVLADPAPALPITLAAALALQPGEDAIFIDVMPAIGGVREPRSGVWKLREAHATIPGALWFPEVGRAPADADLWDAFEQYMRALRREAPERDLVVFCLSDCWMSWNAARRLARLGLKNVRWLAEGIDGWHSAGRELVAGEPVPLPEAR
ncbi:MAG: rhodanese-like domain-containing protein [Erythrobacter sp.]|jgi:PQQ-dependent catabolism-associated CXXCW motif protein|nr:rhodanese-like domain-containing protein [Erythrobacter sp.]